MIKSLRRITASNTMTQKLAAALASVILLAAPVAGHAALVGIGFGGSVYSINETTGAGTLLGSSGFGATNSMARNSAGILYSATNSSLITINPGTGAGTLASTLSGFGAEGLSIRGLAFSSTGVLYAVNNGNNGGALGDTTTNDLLYTINASTGAMTLVGTMAFVGVQALAFSSGSTLYGFDIGGGLITIDPLTAAATDVNPAIGGGGNDIQTIAFSPGGTLYGGRDNLFTIDLTTGASTLVGGGSGGTFVDVRGMEFLAAGGPVPVPEPGTLALLGIGVVGLAFYRRKRTR